MNIERAKVKVSAEKENSRGEKRFIVILALFSAITILFNIFIAQFAFVNGSSMHPNLKHGQILLVSKISKTNLERGDIVVFKKDGTLLIKRLIGLPNEKVQIKSNNIYINDEKIDDFVDVEMTFYGILNDGVTLSDGEYIFLGDNRNNSKDSRNNTVGVISEDEILGKVVFRLMPPKIY